MKLITAIALVLALAVPASAQTTTFRDAFSRTTGTARTDRSGTTHFSDAFGRTTGTARTDSNGTTHFYDSFGRSTGTATTPLETRRR